ncbi:MAG TPA: MFS transporter [Spirochaetota bacterium]|nr:MFS transporter [Spirochaetota bacterium]HPR47638.1 MFS transporter [Spirochaetota bacterium]
MSIRAQKRFAGFRNSLRSLNNRNYRLYFIGQGISFIGTWIQTIATGWLIYRITGSEFMLGIVAFSGQVPAFLASPLAGVLADRLDRHRILVVMQFIAMAQASVLAFLTVTETVQVWHIALLSVCLGLVNAFDMPTRHAFVTEIIDYKADLVNAIALNSVLFNASRLLGPAVAGILVAAAGEGACFLINAASYGVALISLLLMSPRPLRAEEERKNILLDMKDGASYALRSEPIRFLLGMTALMSLVAMSFPVLMPVFAAKVLQGDSHTYGFLVAASGLGALFGTFFLTTRRDVLGLEKVICVALLIFGSALTLFSFSRTIWLSLLILVFIGFGMVLSMASCNTVLQTIVDDDKRGRVMSFYIMAFAGAAPLGSLIAGTASSLIGAPLTVGISGLLSLGGAAFFIWKLPGLRSLIRPIYRKMGILPEVAAAIQATDDFRKPPEYSGN